MSEPAARFSVEERDGRGRVVFSGMWTVRQVPAVDDALRALVRSFPAVPGEVELDLSGVRALDTAGAWVIHRTGRDLEAAGARVRHTGLDAAQEGLIRLARESDRPCAVTPEMRPAAVVIAERMGRAVVALALEAVAILNMLGLVLSVLAGIVRRPGRLRFTSVVSHMERVGLDAVPIVALLTFLIGAVLAQQGAAQLRLFGAEVFTVNLVAISVLREIGVLITAIIVAGRSGSAFTAEIGSMKVNEEVDAMRTLGLDPMAVLVVPRVIALVVMLPILTLIADVMGLLGGGVVAWVLLDISPQAYVLRVDGAVDAPSYLVGLIKAPFMAMAIAVIGCLEGLRVSGSAESVGQRTTSSVVKAIFTVIVLDALFAMFFTAVDF